MVMTNKRTKIITTIGPSTNSKEAIKKLFFAGMNTIRVNFSHGSYKEQGKKIEIVKELIVETKLPISIMLDTKGPEIRIGKFKNDKLKVKRNQEILIYSDPYSYKNKLCEEGEMTISYDISQDLVKGKKVLVDDGKLTLEVVDIKPQIIKVVSKNEHVVKNNKRVNLTGTKFSMPFLSKKDIADIKFGIQKDIDFIAASFVNSAQDIKQIREILKQEKAEHIKIFSKIESQYAVDNIDEIIDETDGLMVARGDLGLEIPFFDVPIVEKMLIRKMRKVGKPVIVATQMLDSMENNPHPTRAEVTDVYLAVELGSDAVMLSGETAVGNYPTEAVEVMTAISIRAEKEFYKKTYYEKYVASLPSTNGDLRSKKAKEITLKTQNGQYKFVVVRSRTGKLLNKIAQYRPNTDILGVVYNKKDVTKFGITSSVFVYPEISAFFEIKKDHKNAKSVVTRFGGTKGDKYLVVDRQGMTEHSI